MHKYFANTLFVGKQIVFLPSCHSTNDITAELVPAGKLLEGAIVITDKQTSGRGQRGSTWDTAPGKNLTFSLLLKPAFLPVQSQFFLNVFISIAIVDFLKKYVTEGVSIKWPNDIYIGNKKLGGILIENSLRKGGIEHTIIGIGLNINQYEFAVNKATSLRNICQLEFELHSLLNELLIQIERRYLQLRSNQYDSLLKKYLAKLYWRGEKRVFKTEDYFVGEIEGVDEIGRLRIKTSEGLRKFNLKEVAFIA